MSVMDQAANLRALAAMSAPAAPAALPSVSVHPRPISRARVIAITSGKGGVGKSNIAVNLAIQFSAAGRDVVLIDADLGLANADVLCNLDLQYNLSHVLARKKDLRDVMVDAPGGFRLIGGASGLARMADLSDFDLQRLVHSFSEVERQADILLIDTGAGISPNVLSFTRAADQVLVVTTPEPTAITDAYAVVKVISREGKAAHAQRISLLVNQVRSAQEARAVYGRIAGVARQFLNLNVQDAGSVCLDESVSAAVRRRVPFTLGSPQAPASQCIAQLARRLEEGEAPEPQSTGFFHRLVRWMKR